MRAAGSRALAQLTLSSIVYGGVFDRFPGLVVLVEEFGLRWVDAWLDTLGPLKRNGSPNFGAWFGWDLKRSPEEYLRENLRFSPRCSASGSTSSSLCSAPTSWSSPPTTRTRLARGA